MAEPARQQDEEIYDQPGNAPSRPQLQALEGGSETARPTRSSHADLGSAESLKDKENTAAASTHAAGHENPVGQGWRPGNEPSRGYGSIRQVLSTRRKKVVAAGALLAATVAATIAIFLALLPLKILTIMNDLQSHFFSSSDSAMSQEESQLESNYIKKYVLPSLKSKAAIPGEKCGTSVLSTIDRNCRTVVSGKGLVANLYTSWAQAGLEHDLASNYGIEFGYQNGSYWMKAPGLGLGSTEYNIDGFENNAGEGLGTFISDDTAITQKFGSTKDFKAAVASRLDQTLQNETRYKQVMYKYKVVRYAETKFGIKTCIVACDTRRDFSDWKDKKTAAVIIQAQRVLQPNNQMLAFVLGCIGSGKTDGNCSVLSPTKEDPTTQPTIDPNGGCTANCIDNGAPLSPAAADVQGTVDSLAVDYALDNPEDLAAAQKLYQTLTGNGGYKKYLSQTVVDKLLSGAGLSDEASKAASELSGKVVAGEVPVVGYVLLAAQVNNMAIAAGAILPAMGYMLQSQTMVHEYGIYRTFADEIKDPSAPKDAAIVGSFTDSLGSGNQNPDNPSDPEVGGTAEAEQTPLYSALMGDGSGTGGSNYLCDNGKPVPAGQLICAEEKVDAKSKANVAAITSNEPGFIKQLSSAAGLVNDFLGGLASLLSGLPGVGSGLNYLETNLLAGLKAIPGVSDLVDSAGSYFRDTFLPISPVSSNTSGGRTFDMIAGGNDVVAAGFSHNGLGGVALTSQQTSAILTQQHQQQNLQNKNQPLVAKLFNTNNSSSLVSKVALAMPNNLAGAKTDLASFFLNPFDKIASAFGSLFGFGHVQAASVAGTDPFDITQYGYPTNDPIFSQDPEAYWDQHCTTNAETAAWNQAAANQANTNPNDLHIPDNLQPSQSGQPSPTSDPTGTNPCLLIQAAVGSAGALFNTSLLTPDDLGQ